MSAAFHRVLSLCAACAAVLSAQIGILGVAASYAGTPPASVVVHVGEAVVTRRGVTYDVRFTAVERRVPEALVVGMLLENPLPTDSVLRTQMSEGLRDVLDAGILPSAELFSIGRRTGPGFVVCKVREGGAGLESTVIVRNSPRRVLDAEKIAARCARGSAFRPPRRTPTVKVPGTLTVRVDVGFHGPGSDGVSPNLGTDAYQYTATYVDGRVAAETLDPGADAIGSRTWAYTWTPEGNLLTRALDVTGDGGPEFHWTYEYDSFGTPNLERLAITNFGTTETPLPALSGPPHILFALPSSGGAFLPAAIVGSNFEDPTVPYVNGVPSISLFNFGIKNIPFIGSFTIGSTLVPLLAPDGAGALVVESHGLQSNQYPFTKN